MRKHAETFHANKGYKLTIVSGPHRSEIRPPYYFIIIIIFIYSWYNVVKN